MSTGSASPKSSPGSQKMSSEVQEGMLTKLLCRYLKERLILWVQEETHGKKNPDTICPMQQTHPSDEPDQGTKGTEGPDTRASVRKNSNTTPTQGTQYSEY